MSVRSGIELARRLAVVVAGRTTIVFDLHRVVDVVADHCMMAIRLIIVPPIFCMLQRIVIKNKGIIIIRVWTRKIQSSLLSQSS